MRIIIFLILGLIASVLAYQFLFLEEQGSAEGTRVVSPSEESEIVARDIVMSDRTKRVSDRVVLPVPGSAPVENVEHSISIEEIRLGCPRQDCIPSIENPAFISSAAALSLLPDDAIGISLIYKDETRFYPFPMLETRELVNDVVAGDPLLISYCPLCGTGVVFDRVVGDEVLEFGVSGMLWQSNLLMYNRADDLAERNLWSQVLGEAVVGARTGTKLTVIPSDIMRFGDWREQYPDGQVLDGGPIRDPYNGEYYSVAQHFQPNFDPSASPLAPMEYVYGIEIDGIFKAYPRAALPVGVTTDTVNGTEVSITVTEQNTVQFATTDGQLVPDIEGFWFSWVAAHPETLLWGGEQ